MTKDKLKSLLAALRAAPGPSRELDAQIEIACFGGSQTCSDAESWNGETLLWSTSGKTLAEFVEVYPQHLKEAASFYLVERRTSSLDAAAAFRERELPGWDYCISRIHGEYEVSVGPEGSFMSNTELCATECLSIVAAVVAGMISVAKRDDSLIAQEGKRD